MYTRKKLCTQDRIDNLISENKLQSDRLKNLEEGLNTLRASNEKLMEKNWSLVSLLSENHDPKTSGTVKDLWLGDEVLQHYVTANADSVYQLEDILVIDPAISHFIKLSEAADSASHLDGLQILQRRFIFACVNSSNTKYDPRSLVGSGSHWSLLVIDVKLGRHFIWIRPTA